MRYNRKTGCIKEGKKCKHPEYEFPQNQQQKVTDVSKLRIDM